jgi:drug/metabolite transporter (DMT)-like permease
MKRVVGWAVVVAALAFALGIWVGLQPHRFASSKIEAGLAIVIGCNLLLALWLWYRARPGSGDAMAAPVTALLSASMLVGILPRVFWPADEGIRIAGLIASVIATTGVVIMQRRRRRRLRRGV